MAGSTIVGVSCWLVSCWLLSRWACRCRDKSASCSSGPTALLPHDAGYHMPLLRRCAASPREEITKEKDLFGAVFVDPAAWPAVCTRRST